LNLNVLAESPALTTQFAPASAVDSKRRLFFNVVLSGFVWLLMRVLRVADYSANFANSMIAVGEFAWIMTHLVVNVMAMTGITPLTGITLPLLSYGGTSMMAVAGILVGLGLCRMPRSIR
jgi:cell division protein FtsW (lipid II flippase)